MININYYDNKKTLYINDESKWDICKKGKNIIKTTKLGEEVWLYENKLHREDGPALKFVSGGISWYLDGNSYTEENWKFEMRKRKLEALGI